MKKLFELFLFFMLLSLFEASAYAASYTIIDLGPMVTPVTINNKSVITGYKTTPDGHHTAFYYSRRVMHDLGTFNGTDSEALDVNSSGVIVGTFTQNGARRGFKLTGSTFTDLFATAGMVDAVGINDSGAILGSVRDPVYGSRMPVILQNGVTKDISAGMSREESMDCSPVRLNNLGEAAFYQVFCGSWECENSYLYRNATTVDILPVPFLAHHVNNNSQVVGRQIVSWFVLKGVIYRNGVLTTMNDFGGDQTFPTAINDLGQVVGKAQKPNSQVFSAFRYQNGAMVDLNTLLPVGSGWNLSSDTDDTVADINNYGQIVGKGMLNGEERGFLFSPQYSASGTVKVGSATGPALAGATVSIAGSTTTTSSTGTFSIPGILPGVYTATVSKTGYVTTTAQLVVDKDLSGLVYYLAPAPLYSISGTVRAGSSTGAVLPGVTVSIAGKSVVTGSTGAFTITGIPAGTYTLTLEKFGYIKKTYSGYTVSSNRSGLVFYLTPAPTYYLSGTVRAGSSTGAVLPGVTVSIAGKSVVTGSTGTFSITGIPAGTYTLTLAKFGYVTKTYSGYTVSSNRSGLVFYLTPAPTYYLSGTVRAGSGTGPVLPGVTVSIAGKSVVTGSTGAFTITGIPAGTYTLTLEKFGYVKKTYSGYAVSGNRSGVVFYLVAAPTYSMSGTVRIGSSTGAVLPGATVSIAGKSAVTGSTGTFSISGIPAGTYTLTIYKTGYQKKTYTGYAITGNKTGLVFYLVPATASLSPGRSLNARLREARVAT